MELKLVVLAGAKQGLEIPLKKDKFLIGRAKECSLCAGSEAISRRHCAIVRKAMEVDGARSGQPQRHVRQRHAHRAGSALKAGDELRVGPLKFRVDGAEAAKPAMTIPPLAPPAEVEAEEAAAGQRRRRRRQAHGQQGGRQHLGRRYLRWLLGIVETNGDDKLKETLTISMEETKALIAPASRPKSCRARRTRRPRTTSAESDTEPAEEPQNG